MLIIFRAKYVIKKLKSNIMYLCSCGFLIREASDIVKYWSLAFRGTAPREYSINRILKALIEEGKIVITKNNGIKPLR